jgi:hypothetical protein
MSTHLRRELVHSAMIGSGSWTVLRPVPPSLVMCKIRPVKNSNKPAMVIRPHSLINSRLLIVPSLYLIQKSGHFITLSQLNSDRTLSYYFHKILCNIFFCLRIFILSLPSYEGIDLSVMKFPAFSWNLKFHCRVYKQLSLDCIPSPINPFYISICV